MCCPLYIIRCDAPAFNMSKSQRKVLKKLQNYLVTTETLGSPPPTSETTPPPPNDATPTSKAVQQKRVPSKGVGPDPLKPPCRKAKDIRRERKQSKITTPTTEEASSTPPTTKGTCQVGGATKTENKSNSAKSLEELLDFPSAASSPAHLLDIRLVRSHPPSPEFKASLEESYQVYKKYQINVHKDTEDDVAMEKYRRFLVESPLVPEPGPTEWDIGYGSYHQQYYLDGRLVMVGVVDILPHCVSSKYLYYDTSYEHLKLGVVSALNEIALTRRLHSTNQMLRYYCMGYYQHGCQKMRYKGGYAPSYLLCTHTNTYVPIDKCRTKLDIAKYSKLADAENPNEETKNPVESYIDSTSLLLGNRAVPYGLFKMAAGQEIAAVRDYAELVGHKVAANALLVPPE